MDVFIAMRFVAILFLSLAFCLLALARYIQSKRFSDLSIYEKHNKFGFLLHVAILLPLIIAAATEIILN